MIFMRNLNFFFQKQQVNRDLSENQLQVHSDKLSAFLKEKGGNHVSHLIFLQDKQQFWSSDQSVLIMYKQIFNKFVVLGDPIGDEAHFGRAIKEFNEYCKWKKAKPVFYQVTPQYMQHYHDGGYRFVKLGEEAVIKLNQFTLEGKKAGKFRNTMSKFSRSGFSFSVAEPPHSQMLIAEIQEVSNSWLGSQKEKGFSVVSFCQNYVSHFPIAVLRDDAGKITAFATLADDYKQTLSIDLMRKTESSPPGAMDMLFLSIFEWAKNNQFQECSLGMAPLSNVGDGQDSFMAEKMIRLVYRYGNKKYNFKGLREYKSKFATDWEPKYLAYKKSFLPVIFLQLIVLINRKRQLQEKAIINSNDMFIKKVFRKLDF
ncbi:phosphatidylglycerol lysyltransferase domain-containing protein [Cytobacillus gottheilii]|uniref:phosphatidylglycerol lysyltransferase domain-containing protein n=1 Tax=Cytobacillus gottheilii TaxID=859144 RepID=UPI00082C30B8|nr:phosphatidylglycerol lysyltransferase domain-containing protein [Cytobacillus gottheilii]